MRVRGSYRRRLIVPREKNCRLLRASDTFTLRDRVKVEAKEKGRGKGRVRETPQWKESVRWLIEPVLKIEQSAYRARAFRHPLALTVRGLQPVILRLALPTISACRCLLVILLPLFFTLLTPAAPSLAPLPPFVTSCLFLSHLLLVPFSALSAPGARNLRSYVVGQR